MLSCGKGKMEGTGKTAVPRCNLLVDANVLGTHEGMHLTAQCLWSEITSIRGQSCTGMVPLLP